MLVKDKFLEKINCVILITAIFFSQNLVGETTKSKIENYNNSLKNSSALFVQSDGETLEEGIIYFGVNRIKIDYVKPIKLTLIVSEKKGMYTNHSLRESQYFNTKKSYIKTFFKILKGESFSEITNVSKNFIELVDIFILDSIKYKVKIIYENDPIKLRKIVILENNLLMCYL